jgi:uncharacterized membrane protein
VISTSSSNRNRARDRPRRRIGRGSCRGDPGGPAPAARLASFRALSDGVRGRSAVDDVTITRAVHVLSVVLWIGGVGFVTTVLLPAVRGFKAPEERVAFFETVERPFAWQARFTTALAGLTGFYMLVRLDLWDRFLSIAYWWLHAMVGVWLLFTLMLFVAEPLFLHRRLLARARADPASTFRLVERLHRILLTLSLITLLGAVLGSHGVVFFE